MCLPAESPKFQGRKGKTLEKQGTSLQNEENLTLHALQKTFVDFFFEVDWGFCIEKWRGFLVNFFWSPSPTKRSTKTPGKLRGKFGAKFGTKIRKIRGTFVLQLFWPKAIPPTKKTRRRRSGLSSFAIANRKHLSLDVNTLKAPTQSVAREGHTCQVRKLPNACWEATSLRDPTSDFPTGHIIIENLLAKASFSACLSQF